MFYRELSICIESLNERFTSQIKKKDPKVGFIEEISHIFKVLNREVLKILSDDLIFDDIIYIIGGIFKANLLKTEVFTKDLAINQLNLIDVLEENFSSMPDIFIE